MVLFTLLYKVVLTFESVDQILRCDHTKEYYRGALLQGDLLTDTGP